MKTMTIKEAAELVARLATNYRNTVAFEDAVAALMAALKRGAA